MTNDFSELRKNHERQHGQRIARYAVDVWGWGSAAGRVRARRRADLLIRHAEIKGGDTVLEFGCGTGLFTRWLAETGATVVGVDLSEDLIREALKEGLPNVTFQEGDVEALSFENERFDAVVGSSVLHHVRPDVSLREAWRVLRRGGRIAFAEPNMLNPQIAIQKNVPFIKRALGDSPDERAFTRWQVGRILADAGFIDSHVEPYDFLHPLVPMQLISIAARAAAILESIPLVREIAGSLIFWAQKPL